MDHPARALEAELNAGTVPSDIRASVTGAAATAAGVPLTIRLQLVNADAGCASLAGHAVYLWHCDRDGLYSLYPNGVTAQHYLRGVQEADANGLVTFATSFPACYAGRMPHVHLEVYPTLAKSTNAANRVGTTQLTFPLDTLHAVYPTAGYGQGVRRPRQAGGATGPVSSDAPAPRVATVSGDPVNGYLVTVTVAIGA